jgi:hypothetical protein
MTAFTMCSATRMFRPRSQNAISGSIILLKQRACVQCQ